MEVACGVGWEAEAKRALQDIQPTLATQASLDTAVSLGSPASPVPLDTVVIQESPDTRVTADSQDTRESAASLDTQGQADSLGTRESLDSQGSLLRS